MERNISIPSFSIPCEESTIFRLFGSGRPMDSKVFRPITIVPPVVRRLKFWRSSGRCHGSCPLLPITRLSAIAAIRMKSGVFEDITIFIRIIDLHFVLKFPILSTKIPNFRSYSWIGYNLRRWIQKNCSYQSSDLEGVRGVCRDW